MADWRSAPLRPDLAVIAANVAPGSRVLDVGCGDGALMAALRDERGVDARGLELDAGNVAECVARGLSVMQGDADADLADYPDAAFDYAILSQTLQTTRRPDKVLDEHPFATDLAPPPARGAYRSGRSASASLGNSASAQGARLAA